MRVLVSCRFELLSRTRRSGMYSLEYQTSGPLRSSGVICSHGDLLLKIRRATFMSPCDSEINLAVQQLNKKLAQTRGENLFHAVPPDLSRADSLRTSHLAFNGAIRSTYSCGRAATHPHIQFYAREWFSVIFPGRDSQSSISSPCQGLDHVLVSVSAFLY